MEAVAILVPIICSLGLFVLIGTIWVSSIRARKARACLEADLRARLLERSSVPSDPQVIRSLAEAESRLLSRDHILRDVRWASVLILLGGTFCLLARIEDWDMLIPGLLLAGAGVGFVAATVIEIRLCRSWDVLKAQPGDLDA